MCGLNCKTNRKYFLIWLYSQETGVWGRNVEDENMPSMFKTLGSTHKQNAHRWSHNILLFLCYHVNKTARIFSAVVWRTLWLKKNKSVTLVGLEKSKICIYALYKLKNVGPHCNTTWHSISCGCSLPISFFPPFSSWLLKANLRAEYISQCWETWLLKQSDSQCSRKWYVKFQGYSMVHGSFHLEIHNLCWYTYKLYSLTTEQLFVAKFNMLLNQLISQWLQEFLRWRYKMNLYMTT